VSTVLQHLSSSAGASIAILGFTAVGGIVSARYLLPTGKGELTAVVLWPTLLVSLGGLGLTEAITYYSATTRDRTRQILSTALGLAGVSLAFLLPIAYAVLPTLLSHYSATTVQTARWFLLFVPVSLASVLMMAALQGDMQIAAFNTLRSLVQILTVAGMLLAVALGHATVRAFATATYVANLATFTTAAVLVIRSKWIGWPSMTMARPLLRFGLQSQLGTLASLANLRLDQMLMSVLMAASLLGIYVVAVTVAGLATLAPSAIIIVAAPTISGHMDPAAKVKTWGRLLRLSVLLQAAVAGALWIGAPYLIALFFGSTFAESTQPARVLIVASLPLGVNMVMAAGFRGFNQPLTPSTAELVSLGATVLGLALFLRPLGPTGAALASLIAYSVTCVFLMTKAWTHLGIRPSQLIAPNRRDWLDIRTKLQRRVPEGT
jgi:O-antigen/teichoic acid export membrane protein